MLNQFLITLGFMTRIPIPRNIPYKEGELEKGLVWFPLIGLILGGISACVYGLSSRILPESMAIVLAILSNLCLTGAFHLDGLCDTVDGIYSARSKERMLEIMKDSRIGTNGVIALVLNLVWKYMGIYYSTDPLLLILLLPITGKMIQGVLGYQAIYPRKEGLGLFVGTVTKGRTIVCFCFGMLLLFGGFFLFSRDFHTMILYGSIGSFGVLCMAIFFRKYIEKKIGGITGDVMGAGSEICECFFIFCMMVVSR